VNFITRKCPSSYPPIRPLIIRLNISRIAATNNIRTVTTQGHSVFAREAASVGTKTDLSTDGFTRSTPLAEVLGCHRAHSKSRLANNDPPIPRPIPAATSHCCQMAIESILVSRAEGRRGCKLFHVRLKLSARTRPGQRGTGRTELAGTDLRDVWTRGLRAAAGRRPLSCRNDEE